MSDEATRDDVPRRPANELSHKATVNQMRDIRDEIDRVSRRLDDKVEKGEEIPRQDEEYLEDLAREFDELDTHRKALEREALRNRVDVSTRQPLTIVDGAGNGVKRTEMDSDPLGEPESVRDGGVFANPWDLSEVRTWNRSTSEVGSELRARAFSAIEKLSGASDETRQAMTDIIEKYDTPSGKLAKQAIVTSHPDYVRAFAKAAMGRESAMNERERAAVERAMSLTDTAGGYLVPFQLDPAVIITSDGTTNPVREIARKVVATGDTWNGVSSAAVSWSWDAEAAEVSDDATTFAQPSISIHKAQGFVPISIEALQDEQNVAQEVGRLLAFGKDDLEAAAFVTGTGSGQPFGIVTALSGTASEVSATTNNSFGLVDLYALDGALPARHRRRASWIADRAIYNLIRQFDTGGGAALWERLGADVPALLLGRPAYEASEMDGAIATGDDRVLVFGDFSNYVVADRIGTSVEFIPHLFATASNLPSGQRGWFAYYRVGADSVNDGAFRQLLV